MHLHPELYEPPYAPRWTLYTIAPYPPATDMYHVRRSPVMRLALLLAICLSLEFTGDSFAADIAQYPFEVSETAGIRRRNDVITLRTSKPEIVEHAGNIFLRHGSTPIVAQARTVEWPGEPPELVVDFIDHFQPFETREYVLEVRDLPSPPEPADGLKLTETDAAWQIDSSGVVIWTIRKDLKGLLDFSWKGVDYIADDSDGFYVQSSDATGHRLAERAPTQAAVERAGPLAVGLRFDYDNWPAGGRSTVKLEFPRTKSWIHATWTVAGDPAQALILGAGLNVRLDGPEALIDFGAGDFVYATVTNDQSAILVAGPRDGGSIDWSVRHGTSPDLAEIFVAPRDVPTPRVHGWAHVMDDKRCTALAIARFGESAVDSIRFDGSGRLDWQRNYSNTTGNARQLEFWLHFVTMPVHIGARTSPRSMQEPLQVRWLGD
ncbi:MAG: hypothetical protein JNG89_15190 [Planctomycetaceae bacterium]|nr:hypothetical protein [Planctomycetaceae bacterium]